MSCFLNLIKNIVNIAMVFFMGSPLGSTLANLFMCHFEIIWLENYPTQSNLLCIEDMWTTYFYFFVPQNTQKNLKIILTSNTKTLHLFFFYRQFIFDPRPENCLSFSKKPPQKLFSICLVVGLWLLLFKYSNILSVTIVYYRNT